MHEASEAMHAKTLSDILIFFGKLKHFQAIAKSTLCLKNGVGNTVFII